MHTLGIVGGIGPESTIDYYRQLMRGYRERAPDGRPPHLLISSIDSARVLELAAAPEPRSALVEYLLLPLNELSRAGASVALLAANTPHIVFEALNRRSPLPLISIVDAARDFAIARGWRRLGLYGTRFTMRGGFYHEAFAARGLEIVLPEPDELDYIHDRYVTELVAGRFLPETRAGLLAIAAKMRARERIDALVLGGTELPLILTDWGDTGVELLDTTRVHVNAALEQMLADP